ncbi:MAG TPA: glycosyl hydrolase, partial [Myxococcota bacterium]|nr:glycosyl hydrolase [Myxococcota bacterium]
MWPLLLIACSSPLVPSTREPSADAPAARGPREGKAPRPPGRGGRALPDGDQLLIGPEALPTDAPARTVALNPGAALGPLAPLMGVNGGPSSKGAPANIVELYQRVGIRAIRTHDYNGAFDLAPIFGGTLAGDGDFSSTDGVYRQIAEGGFGLFLRVGDSYHTATPIENIDMAQKKMVATVRHLVNVSKAAGRPLEYVEIWNEPDNTTFWKGDQANFFRLFEGTAKEIRRTFPELKIVGPALTPGATRTPKGMAWAAAFFAMVKEKKVPLDAISWHMYANKPELYIQAASQYRSYATEQGWGDLPQIVSEWNSAFRPTGGSGAGQAGAEVREKKQASAVVGASWIAMQQAGVDDAYFYCGVDPAMEASHFYGLFRPDGSSKPAGLAFVLFKELLAHPTRVDLALERSENLWVLGGQNGAGEVAILLANVSGERVAWESGRAVTERWTVAEPEAGVVVDQGAG